MIRLIVHLLVLLAYVQCTTQSSTKELPTVFWMHIQKTSSWLGNFLLLWGCSAVRQEQASFTSDPLMYSAIAKRLTTIPCETAYYTGNFGYGYHVPFPQNFNGTTVTLFRNPYSRVISSFLYGKGKHQIMFPLGFPNRAKVKFDLREQIRKSQYPILTYVQLPGIASCQTKMVLGKECGEPANISEAQLKEALRRVRQDMAFVGLTEESEASAELFLAMYRPAKKAGQDGTLSGAETEKLVSMLAAAPRKNRDHTAELDRALLAVLQQHDWRDVLDEAVYIEAVRVFYERCRRYNVPTAHTQEELLALHTA